MALRSTIYKCELQIADLRRHYYADHALTLALHPSENDERMMVRVLAFALFAAERLSFTRGLSATDEPDLWQKDYTDAIELWIDVGQPDETRIKKACSRSEAVVVMPFGHAAHVWWQGLATKVARFDHLQVLQIADDDAKALGQLASRSMQLQCTIDEDGGVLVTAGDAVLQIHPVVLKAATTGAAA